MISLNGVSKSYGTVAALRPTSLDVLPGQRLALLGASGSGKTTLLRLIAGLESPDRGTILLDGALASGPGVVVPPHARDLGMVLDRPALWPHLSSWRNVTFGMDAPRSRGARERAMELLDALDLDAAAGRLPGALSSGEAQRVALARALAASPRRMLLDEPFSNLDARCTDLALRLLASEADRTGATVVLVTHAHDVARRLCTEVAALSDGALRAPAAWAEARR